MKIFNYNIIKAWIFYLLIIVFIVIFIPIVKAQSNQTALPQTTTLSFIPEKKIITGLKPQKIDVILSGLPVYAADIVIKFNPKLISIEEITNGEVFEGALRTQIEKDSILYSGADSPQNLILKQGTVLSFKVIAKTTGVATLEFDDNQTITARDGVNTRADYDKLGTAKYIVISTPILVGIFLFIIIFFITSVFLLLKHHRNKNS